MKKMLGVLLAMAIAFPASADVLKNVNLKGEIQTIASDVDHQMDGDLYNSGTNARVLAGLSFDLVEDVTANLMFQYNNAWGTDGATGKTMQGYWDNIRLAEGNVVLSNLFCCLEATIGRQFYGEEDSAVMYFGPNHYNAEAQVAQSLDAVKLTYSDDFKAFTMIAGRISVIDDELDEAGVMDEARATLMGADLKLKLTDEVNAQVYAYNVNALELIDNAGIVYDIDGNAGFYGAKLGLDLEAFRAAAEYTRNYGLRRGLFKETAHTGHMAKVDVAMDIEALTARAAFLYANENFWAFGNYTPGLIVGHKMAGDIFDFSVDGVRMFNLGFDMKAFEKWTFALDGFAFQSSRGHHAATWEADLTAKYAHNEYVELFAGVGYAKYGNEDSDFSKAAMDVKDNVKGQLGMLIKF